MQSPTRNSEYPKQRQRCGGCTAFCAPSTGPRVGGPLGICAHTNDTEKVAGTVSRDQASCIYRPSKFKAKEHRS